MIGYLRGKVIVKQANNLMIDTGGVGYEVSVPISVMDAAEKDQECELFIHHNVREDGHYLFGFATLSQRQLFRELIRVNGIGPKLALLVLSGFSVDALVAIIREQNAAELIKLPGIGKKTAERLLIELGDRIGNAFATTSTASAQETLSMSSPAQDTEQALIALGYKPVEAAKLVANALAALEDQTIDSDVLLKKALQFKFQSAR